MRHSGTSSQASSPSRSSKWFIDRAGDGVRAQPGRAVRRRAAAGWRRDGGSVGRVERGCRRLGGGRAASLAWLGGVGRALGRVVGLGLSPNSGAGCSRSAGLAAARPGRRPGRREGEGARGHLSKSFQRAICARTWAGAVPP